MPRLTLRQQDLQAARKRQKTAFERAEQACSYLCELGASEVYIFGSLLGDDFRERSDIDLAVSGLPMQHIYRVEAEIEEILQGMPFQLVYLEYAPEYLAKRIRERGRQYACHIPGR